MSRILSVSSARSGEHRYFIRVNDSDTSVQGEITVDDMTSRFPNRNSRFIGEQERRQAVRQGIRKLVGLDGNRLEPLRSNRHQMEYVDTFKVV